MMMTTRNDIKDRLIHNQSPYPTKDKVLSYTIPVDHSETLLFCSSNSSSNSSTSGVSNGANGSSCNNGSLNFITSDDDPCNGSLASFLDEGLGTSLDGVDEIASPIFPTLGRNDSGVFSSDEGTGAGATLPQTLNNGTHSQNSHPRVIPPTISSTPNACSSSGNAASSRLCISTTSTNNLLSSGEVVSWKSLSGVSPIATSAPPTSSLALSQTTAPTTATISVVTDSVTGIPSIICTATIPPPPVHISSDKSNSSNSNNRGGNNNHNSTSPLAKVEVPQVSSKQSNSGKGTSQQPAAQQQQRNKSMPLGRQGPQKCTICDKVFSNASALTKHKLTHSDERRHACATCGKAFKRQDHLNGHMLTHRNKKPFECKSKGCGKSYCDARSLRRHVENRHGHEVLESMNLTSQKHGNKNSNNNSNNSNNQHNSSNFANNNQPEPQPELVQFTPVKSEPTESNHSRKNNANKSNSPKILDRMPILQPEPQLELDFNTHLNNSEKVNISAKPLISLSSSVPQRGSSPPTLHKVGESSGSASGATAHFLNASTSVTGSGLPILLKRENVSVFDFDETLEDVGNPGVPCISSNVTTHGNQQQHDKLLPSAIKVSGIIDPAKLGSFPDLKLFQEWSKRLGDSKVALFLASSSAAASSFAQLAGPITSNSLQLDGRPSSGGSLTMSGTSHAFIPTNENGLFSVTPISIVPTSSGEFTLKPANLPMSTHGGTGEPPKPLYILPSDPLLSAGLPPSTLPVSTHISNNIVATEPPPPIVQQNTKAAKESKGKSEGKSEGKEKGKSGGIGANLVNRIKTKLKAGSLKKSSKSGESKNAASAKVTNQHQSNRQAASPVPLIGKQSTLDNDIGGKPILVCHQAHTQSGGILPTLSITGSMNGGGIVSWTCESPNDSLMNGLEEESLSEGGVDGEDKPVECSICKETEGSKKKEVSKEQGHSTPLQTASVSVRALIEEKIKERRNNLLKLAAAAAAEKAASEAAGSQPSQPSQNTSPSALLNFNGQKAKLSETSSSSGNVIAQEQQQSTKLLMENIKLKIGSTNLLPSSEKDKNCDHQVNLSNTTDIISTNSMPSLTNSNSINGNNNAAVVNMDPSFQDLNIIIGNNNSFGATTNDLSSLTSLERETIQLHPSTGTIVPSPFPLQMDRSNFTLLDCGINPEDLCQAVHLIYVNNGGGNNRTIDLPLGALNQDPLGKVSKVLQQPLPAMSTLLPERLIGDNRRSSLKGIMEPLVVCPSTTPSATLDDPCNLPWEWRNSTSSDNTDNSLSHVQDCVNSLLCSSSSDILDESCTKDPVAGGGYCYTPILSPNSSFCLTPGPDSPFEAAQPNQSLSFICPSPSIGSGSIYSSDPSVSSLVNPPSSVEPIFSPEQSQPLPSNSVNTTPTSELMKQHQAQLQQQPELQNTILTSALDQLHSQGVHGEVVNVSSQQLLSSTLPHELINRQNNHGMESLPSINTFPTINSNALMGISDGSYVGPRDVLLQCPMPININNEVHQQQSFVPFEVYTPYPIPKRVCDKWINGKVRKNKKIRVGPDYQAEIPNCKGNKGRKQGHGRDEKLWDPSILDSCSFDEVDKYLEFACCSAVPGGGMNKEYALHLLTLSKGNIREAILRLMEKLPALPAKLRNYSYLENQKWSSEEIITFQISLIQMGKDFAKIAKAVGTKTKAECVCFYYFWKKVCFSEFQIMKQIWKDRLDHQQLQQQQQTLNATISSINNPFICNSNVFGNNDMGFLVPAHDVRSTCK